MSSSKSEEQPIKDQKQTTIPIDVPHDGKKIHRLICSPNMKYIATLSDEDKSIVGWTVAKDLTIEYDNTLRTNKLRFMLNIDKKKFQEIFEDSDALIGVSDYKHIILKLDKYETDNFKIEIIDITNESKQILNEQGLEEKIDSIAFLENGHLAIAKGDPVYRAYIFLKSKSNGKYQWKCIRRIELKKFSACHILQNGKLMMFFKTPIIITQWNLITQKFEMRYVLNWSVLRSLRIKMNGDNTLLAVACTAYEKSVVYVYSTKSGKMMAKGKFEEELHNLCFIGLEKEERLFFSGPQKYPKSSEKEVESYNSYILNPRIYTLDKSQHTDALHDIYSPTFKNHKSVGPINIIDDYIIKINANYLSIQKLSQNERWKDYIERKERYTSNAFFHVEEIKQFVQDTLKNYQSNQIIIYPEETKEHSGDPYTWIVEHEHDVYYGSKIHYVNLKVKNEIDKEKYPLDNSILEYKVLENGDMLLVFTSCIQIMTVKKEKTSDKASCQLIYCRKDKSKPETTETAKTDETGEPAETPETAKKAKESIIGLLTSFKNELDLDSEILPPPTLNVVVKARLSGGEYFSKYYNLKYNELTLKLYGKDLLHELIQDKNDSVIVELLDECYKYSLLMIEDGNIYDFNLLISQIALALIELDDYNKNLRTTETFLSKTNLLIPDDYTDAINRDSRLVHFQHSGMYIRLRYLVNTSLFDRMFFWVSKKLNLLKKSCPQIYNILIYPYSFYLSYFTIYPRKTVKLMIPLLGFATYPKSSFYSELFELFYLHDNPFTSLLDDSSYYGYWNIKALIYFKWNTYGRRYYLIIWTIYTIFMCCFLIISTIPNDEINQIIFLYTTICLGFIHFIFEVRQFIHKPISYITSPWNWFDFVAILTPTITTLLWLFVETPPIWIITIASLLLEIKFLLYFRALGYFGKYFAIMIGVAQKVFSFLVVLGIIVLAFAHSLHLLLRPTSKYSYDQPSNTDDVNNPWNLVSTYQFVSSNGTISKSSLIETPDDNTNMFSYFSTSVLAVYLMLTGDTSSVSSWVLNNNWTLAFLLVIFSFFTTVYLMNLFISLLGNAIDDKNNEESFLQLRGEILSEIELFWMLPYQRRKRNWFPEILYYEASVDELKEYVESVEDKESLLPAILKICKIKNSEEELKKQINEVLKEPLKEIKELIELIKKDQNNNSS